MPLQFRSTIREMPSRAPRNSVRRSLVLSASALFSMVATFHPVPGDAQDLMGVTSHFLHNSRFYPEMPPFWRIDLTLPFIKELGVTTVHEGLYATAAGPRAVISDGKTDAASLANVDRNRKQVGDWLGFYDKAHIKVVLAVIGLPPRSGSRAAANNAEFSGWVADLVAAHPSVVAIQLHNEPNLQSYWPKSTPEEYVDTFRPLALAIKEKRPDVKILFGAISSLWWPPGVAWLKRAIDHGAFDFSDGIAIHPYNVDMPPETDPHWMGAAQSDPEQREKAIKAFYNQVVAWNKGRPFDVYFTEFGWNTSTAGGARVDEATQADYLARSFLIYMDVRLSGIPLVSAYWYDLKDDGPKADKPEHRYGLLSYDLTTKKPSFWAMKALTKEFENTDDFKMSNIRFDCQTALSGVKTKNWLKVSNGVEVFSFWATAPVEDQASDKMKVTFHQYVAKSATLYFADNKPALKLPISTQGGDTIVEVPVSTRPGWIELSKD